MNRQAWQIALVMTLAGIPLLTQLGGARLWDRDEPRNAGCAAEMLARGDWIVPVFNGELRDHKPVLTYWLMMTAYTVVGVNEWGARFWSAALSLGTVWFTYLIGRRLFCHRVGLLAVVILSTSLMFDVAARAATPDAPLIFCSTLALLIYVWGAFRSPFELEAGADGDRPRPRQPGVYFPTRLPVVVALYAVMGLGILAKGPVGLILPTAVIGMFLLIQNLPRPAAAGGGRSFRWLHTMLRPFAPRHFLRTCWEMRLVTAVIVALAVAGPWYATVGWETGGEFLEGFFLKHNLGRATAAMENHSGGPWFYPLAILAGFFPWSVFALPIIIGAVARTRRGDRWCTGYLLMMCWVGVYVGLFTLASTKLPSYVTPCYPALALLAGCFVHHVWEGTSVAAPRWIYVGLAVLAVVGIGIVVGLPIAAAHFLPGEAVLGAIGLVPLAGAVAGFVCLRRNRRTGLVTTLVTMAIVLAVAIFGLATERVDRNRRDFELLAAADDYGPATPLGAFGGLEPSMVFYAQRRIEPLSLDPPDPQAGRLTRGQRRGNYASGAAQSSVADFFARQQDGFVITTGRYYPRLADRLPAGVEVLAEVQRFLKRDTLLLLGRPRQSIRTATDRSSTRPDTRRR